MKLELSIEAICGREDWLIPFFKVIYELEFEEKPYYSRLRHILTCSLMDENEIPNMVFEWHINTDTLN